MRFCRASALSLASPVALPEASGCSIVLPGDFGKLAQGFKLGELRGNVRIHNVAGAQAVAQAEAHVVSPLDEIITAVNGRGLTMH